MQFSKSLLEIQEDLINSKYTLKQLTSQYLVNAKSAKENKNAFVHIFEESAMELAEKLDQKFADGKVMGKLFGAILSIKDNICYKDHPVSAGSKILAGYISPYSATAVEKALNEDAVIIGSTNCDEFGMGSSSTNSYYGPVKNGIDGERIAGGSSGGAAVSVQQDACLMALGSDTGGSVRQPAAFNQVIGFKPSYGVISRHGLLAYGSSFDQIGIIGKNHTDIKCLFEVIKGKDIYDSTSIDISNDSSASGPFKFAYIPEMFEGDSDYIQDCFDSLNSIGEANLSKESFDYMKYLVPTYYILSTAEASSNLSRYDGIKYGHRSKNFDNLETMYEQTRTEGFGAEVKKRIMLGTFVLSEGYFDAYYIKALKIRRLLRDRINEILNTHTALIMPVATSGPWKLNEKIEDPIQVYMADIYTVLANLTGLPAISVPIKNKNSKFSENSSEISLQFIVRKGSDMQLLNLASNLKIK